MSYSTPASKRPRHEKRTVLRSDATLSPDRKITIDYSRCAWLEIKDACDSEKAVRLYVPQDVLHHITSYKGQLDQENAILKGDAQPVIHDKTPRDPEVLSKAIRFLVSGYLFPLDASSSTCEDALHDFIKLYQLSIDLSIEHLEISVLRHIDTFKGLTLAMFLAFARGYYRTKRAEQNGSLGRLIKKKLAEFLQCMIDLKTVDEIKNENGVLSRQLIEVLLKERADAQEKPSCSDVPIKIEDD